VNDLRLFHEYDYQKSNNSVSFLTSDLHEEQVSSLVRKIQQDMFGQHSQAID
jgi:hypothetical protein